MAQRRRLASLIRQGFFCLGIVFITYHFQADARPMNSIQLASGEWDVSIFWSRIDASRIFPSVSAQRSFFSKKRTTRTKSEMIIPSVKRRPWGTYSLDCILSLAPDGTFILAPKKIIKYSSYSSNRKVKEHISMEDCDMSTIEKKSKSSTGVMYMHGCWNVLANPYCLTDRRYDEVSLISYPRQRIKKSGAATDNPEEEERVPPRTVQMTMNCRLWGRHGRQPQQSNRQEINGEQTSCCGKMTHGTIVWKEHGQGVPWWKQLCRPVLGSFSAVRSSKEPKHDGWLDKEFFGY